MFEPEVTWVDSKYHVLGKWGAGGMADIYVARMRAAVGFDKLIALKVLREDLAEEPRFRAMFLEEVKTAALLDHPGIVQTFDAGHRGDRLFMAMEFVNGATLGRFERVIRRRLGELPIPLAVAIAREVADALDYAHTLVDLDGNALHLVHRDVSPSNLLVSFQGRLKLLDFGIAKFSTRTLTTQVGDLKGKLSYMSPEQARGEAIDHRADIFALGVVLWQLLTGTKAFEGVTDVEFMRSLESRKLDPPSAHDADCDGDLDAIVMRAVAHDLDERYSSARQLGADLSAYLAAHAPGFDSTAFIRDLMEEHFADRKKRIDDLLQRDAEAGPPEPVSRPSGPTSSLRSHRTRPTRSEYAQARYVPRAASPLPPRRPWAWVAMAIAAIAIAGAVAVPALRRDSSPSPAAAEPSPATDARGTLVVRTTPASAKVIVDGTLREGDTPTVVAGLDLGVEHDLIVTAPGYEPAIRRFRFDDSRTREIALELRSVRTAFLAARCPGDPCVAVVDGVAVGPTPIERHEVPAETPVRVELRRGGEVVTSRRLTLARGELGRVEPGAATRPRRVVRRRDKEPEAAPQAESKPATSTSSERLERNPYLRGR